MFIRVDKGMIGRIGLLYSRTEPAKTSHQQLLVILDFDISERIPNPLNIAEPAAEDGSSGQTQSMGIVKTTAGTDSHYLFNQK